MERVQATTRRCAPSVIPTPHTTTSATDPSSSKSNSNSSNNDRYGSQSTKPAQAPADVTEVQPSAGPPPAGGHTLQNKEYTCTSASHDMPTLRLKLTSRSTGGRPGRYRAHTRSKASAPLRGQPGGGAPPPSDTRAASCGKQVYSSMRSVDVIAFSTSAGSTGGIRSACGVM